MFGQGFLASWNDVAPAAEAEYQRWHRIEHMPERLSIPGFTLGRRYVDLAAAANRYLTVYEAQTIDTFSSELYRARLAAPTPETIRMSSQMSNFVRRIFRTVASEGVAIGAAAAVFRLQLAGVGDAFAAKLVRALCAVDGTAAAHLGAVDAQMSGLRADMLQSQMAAKDVEPFNAVLLAEADSRAAAGARLAAWRTIIEKSAASAVVVTTQVYDLALIYRPLYDDQSRRKARNRRAKIPENSTAQIKGEP